MLRKFLNFILPLTCPSCRQALTFNDGLCLACWQNVRFVEKPWCSVMGTPMRYDLGEHALSADAIANPPLFKTLRACAYHEGLAKKMVHHLKYNDHMALAHVMAQWMMRVASASLDQCDMIMPVPLYRWRLWQRKYNQSALLAQSLSRLHGLPFSHDCLIRKKKTQAQIGLSASQRERNVKGAFYVLKEHRPFLKDKKICLVDDVYTTGATLRSATKALLKAGVNEVHCVVFSRAMTEPLS